MKISSLFSKLATRFTAPKKHGETSGSLGVALGAARRKAYDASEHYANEYSSGASHDEVYTAKQALKVANKEVASLTKKYRAALKKEIKAASASEPPLPPRAIKGDKPQATGSAVALAPSHAAVTAQSVVKAHRQAVAIYERRARKFEPAQSNELLSQARLQLASAERELHEADATGPTSPESAATLRSGRVPGSKGGLKQPGAPRQEKKSVRFSKLVDK